MESAITALAAALAIALSTMFPAMAQGKAAKAALESIARQPEAAKDIRSTLLLSLALIEALTIYGLLIAFMLPLMVLDEFIKPASLALRLFGNVFGEESVTHNLYDLLPIGAPIIMMALSLIFCAIQAMVYTMLTASYLNEFLEE